MEIDLGIIGSFINSQRFFGGLAIGFPILTFGLFGLYSIFSKVFFIKKILKCIILTFGLSIIILIPFVFFSAFLGFDKLKLSLIYLSILICVVVYTLFNTEETVNFIKDASKLKNKQNRKF
jgi:ABC-type bacteriocin/lantibiotic exporter with double-glycine peptidase domain